MRPFVPHDFVCIVYFKLSEDVSDVLDSQEAFVSQEAEWVSIALNSNALSHHCDSKVNVV